MPARDPWNACACVLGRERGRRNCALSQPKSDLSDFGRFKLPNSGKPEFGVGEGSSLFRRRRKGEGGGFREFVSATAPSPITTRFVTIVPSPTRGEGTRGAPAAVAVAALFLLVVFRHAGAVLVDLIVAPDVLLELPGLSGAVANRGCTAAAHPFAALREARGCQRRRRKCHGKRGEKCADPHHGRPPLSFLRETSPTRVA